jgi:hypothetical protein
MAGKIFYRLRQKAREGAKTPRYRIVAISGLDLKIYGDHFRHAELEQMAESVKAELIQLDRGPKHKDEKASLTQPLEA